MSFVAEDTPSTRRGRVKERRVRPAGHFPRKVKIGALRARAFPLIPPTTPARGAGAAPAHSRFDRTLASDACNRLPQDQPQVQRAVQALGSGASGLLGSAAPRDRALAFRSSVSRQAGQAGIARAGRGTPSLRSLIKRVLPQEDPRQVLRALLHMRGVRRKGAALCADRTASVLSR